MRAAKVPRYCSIDCMQEQERDGFLQCGERTTGSNHGDIQNTVIDVGVGGESDGTSVETRIVDDHLPGLTFPE